MNSSVFKLFVLFSLCLFLVSCASQTRPTIYPNEQFKKVGEVQADVDLQSCMALADNYVKQPNKYIEMGKSGAINAGVGAGTGALAGVIMRGAVGRSTAAGAAVGAIVGIASEAFKKSGRTPSYERFVEHCLQEKGYMVTGWQ